MLFSRSCPPNYQKKNASLLSSHEKLPQLPNSPWKKTVAKNLYSAAGLLSSGSPLFSLPRLPHSALPFSNVPLSYPKITKQKPTTSKKNLCSPSNRKDTPYSKIPSNGSQGTLPLAAAGLLPQQKRTPLWRSPQVSTIHWLLQLHYLIHWKPITRWHVVP